MDVFINSSIIPAWLVAINIFVAGIMLRIAYKRRLRAFTTLSISGTTMMLESIMYVIAFQFFSIDTETRGFIIRLMIITICMSFYVPLFVSYLRSKKRDT